MSDVTPSTIFQLDSVLTCLWINRAEFVTLDGIIDLLLKDTKAVPPVDVYSVLNRLAKDGYVEIKENPEYFGSLPFPFYSITFDGRFWIEGGGYRAEVDRRKVETDLRAAENIRAEKLERTQRVQQTWLVVLTAILAAGTVMAALYYGTELYWNHGWFRFGK